MLKNCPLKFWLNQNIVHNADGDKYSNAMMDYFRSKASHSSWRCECSIFSIFTLVEVIIINCSPQIVCVTQAARQRIPAVHTVDHRRASHSTLFQGVAALFCLTILFFQFVLFRLTLQFCTDKLFFSVPLYSLRPLGGSPMLQNIGHKGHSVVTTDWDE